MTITLEIESDLEYEVRTAAARQRVAPDQFITNLLQQHLRQDNTVSKRFSDTELELLRQINLGLSEETWQQYRELVAKRRAESLTEIEHKILIEISDQIEVANARRIGALAKLAQLRHTTIDALMDQMNLRMPLYV